MYDCFYVFKLECFLIFNFLGRTRPRRGRAFLKNTLTQKRIVFALRNFLSATDKSPSKNTLQIKHCVFHV